METNNQQVICHHDNLWPVGSSPNNNQVVLVTYPSKLLSVTTMTYGISDLYLLFICPVDVYLVHASRWVQSCPYLLRYLGNTHRPPTHTHTPSPDHCKAKDLLRLPLLFPLLDLNLFRNLPFDLYRIFYRIHLQKITGSRGPTVVVCYNSSVYTINKTNAHNQGSKHNLRTLHTTEMLIPGTKLHAHEAKKDIDRLIKLNDKAAIGRIQELCGEY